MNYKSLIIKDSFKFNFFFCIENLKMPNLTRNFYLVESDVNIPKQKEKYNEYENFNSYMHGRKPLKNQWHMPRNNKSIKTKSNNIYDLYDAQVFKQNRRNIP